MRRVIVAAGLVAAVLILIVRPIAQVAREPVTTKIVPGYPSIITLDVPANDFATFEAVRQILDGAEAPYGLEGAVPTDKPPVDFAQRPDRTLLLTGLTVGAALEAVAKANPHFRWSESDGLIVARLTPAGTGLLDHKLVRYVLAGASPREALQTLLTALDPNRPVGLGISGMGRPAMGREGAPPTRVGKNVTLALDSPTVIAALSAVARVNGAMSWVVQYDHAPADASSATITFTESGETVTAVPLDVARAAPVPGLASTDLPITLGDVTTIAANYARVAGIRLGIEQLPLAPLHATRGLPPIRVANLTPAQVLTKIVAYDSRYELAESKSVFYVRPKAGAGVSPLDKKIDSFTATNEALDSVMRRVVSILSPGVQSQNPSIVSSGSPIQQQMAALRARPITLALRGPATIREVLDAVTAAVGPAAWLLRSNSASSSATFFDLSLQMFDQPLMLSWPFTAPFGPVSAGPLPASVSALPPAIAKREIARLFASPDTQPSVFARLASIAGVAMGIEMLAPPAAGADPRLHPEDQPGLTLGPGSFGSALALLLDRMPEYDIANASGVISIAPRELRRAPAHFMNTRIGRFEIKGAPIRAAIIQLRQRLNPKYPGTTSPTTLMYGEKPLTLVLENPTPREVLNALAALQGDVSWTVTYESSAAWVPAQAREADCAITLTAFASGGLNARFPRYVDPAAPPPPPRPASLPRSSLTIDVPVNPRTIRNSLRRIQQVTRTPIGVEMVTPYEPGPSSGLALVRTHTYDVTGLTVEQMLNKVVEFMPDYAWKKDGGVYHLRAKVLAARSNTPLDRKIDSFTQQFPDVRSALNGVLGLFNPTRAVPAQAPPGLVVGGIAGGSPVVDRSAQYTNRPISVDLKGATARDILDALMLKHGDMWWVVNYTDTNGIFPSAVIEFNGFDGWVTGSSTAIR